jgi:hypothetical protein
MSCEEQSDMAISTLCHCELAWQSHIKKEWLPASLWCPPGESPQFPQFPFQTGPGFSEKAELDSFIIAQYNEYILKNISNDEATYPYLNKSPKSAESISKIS